MKIKIISIIKENSTVKFNFNNSEISAIWMGDDLPIIDNEYEIEIDINDNLQWGENVNYTNNLTENIYYKDDYIYLVCKLEYYLSENIARLYFNNTIILAEITGIKKDILKKWVLVRCSNIHIYNINI